MTNALLVWPLHSYLTLVTWDRNMTTYQYVSDTEMVKKKNTDVYVVHIKLKCAFLT